MVNSPAATVVSGDADGLFRNAEKVMVELLVSVEILINAGGVCPGRQISFDTQSLCAFGDWQKPAAERLVAVAGKSGRRGEDEIGELAMRMLGETNVHGQLRLRFGCRVHRKNDAAE